MLWVAMVTSKTPKTHLSEEFLVENNVLSHQQLPLPAGQGGPTGVPYPTDVLVEGTRV